MSLCARLRLAPRVATTAALLSLLGLVACGDDTAATGASDSASSGTTGAETETGTSIGTAASTTAATTTTGGPSCMCTRPDEACVAGACVDVGLGEIERGCHPLSQGVCMYPWPSNFATRDDPKSATGLRVDLDPELLPINAQGLRFAADQITNVMDGASPHAQIRFLLGGSVRPSDLAGLDAIGGSIDPAATITLLREDGERWPTFAEVDARAVDPGLQAVFVRPAKRLDFGARYLVAVRGLHDPSGALIEASPAFVALRDDLPTDVPEIEALRPVYSDIFARLEAAGIDRGELQIAWDFTTASASAVKADAAALIPQIVAAAGDGHSKYTILEVEEHPGEPVARIIRGIFAAPKCMTGKADPGDLLTRDGDGLPICEGTVNAPFVIAIPDAVLQAGNAAPTGLYGHGLLGTGEEAISVAAQTEAFILVGTDFWGMAEEDIQNVLTTFSVNFDNGRSLPERLLQSVVNFSALGYLVAGDLAADEALQVDGKPLIDTSAIHYLGGSQGGIMGGTVMAMAPNFARGVLVVGGANYSLMVWRSSAFNLIDGLWKDYQADPSEREFLFALFQSAFDLADPAIYAEELISAPFAGNSPKDVLLIESIGDSQVPNPASEMMARTYGMTMLGPPVYDVWGVDNTTEELSGGQHLLQVDTKHTPLPPTENLPPDDDNGAHGSSTDSAAVRELIRGFLNKGVVQNPCDGACDPE